MGTGIKCRLLCGSAAEHLYHLYAGFGELAHRKLIEINPVRLPDYSSRIYGFPILRVEVNDRYKLIYDVMDNYVIPDEFDLS